jgi:CarD family transcriptional regulator
MKFIIGDRVVHPQHGVGEVVKLEDREFGSGVIRRYYEVSIPSAGSTLWVPLEPPAYGLRKLADQSEINACRMILASLPEPLTDDPRTRQSVLVERLKKGTIHIQCKVVRDLYALGENKSLYGSMAGFFRQTQNVLCEEWAVVEEITLEEAVREVISLLATSRRLANKEKL